MEELRKISNRNNWLIIALGIVLAIFTLAPACVIDNDNQDTTEQAEDNDGATTVSELKFEALPSTTQLPVERNSYLIETIPSQEEPESIELPEVNFLPSPARVFKVLFRHIISPNSP